MMIRIIGRSAISYADENGLFLSKFTDPIEDAKEKLSLEEAESVADIDQSLIYIDVDKVKYQNWMKNAN